MPSVQRAQQEYQKSGGPMLLAVSLDGEGATAVKRFLGEHKYTLATAINPDMQLARALGVRATPWTIIVDRSGTVVAGGYGAIDMLSPAFRNYVKTLAAQPNG